MNEIDALFRHHRADVAAAADGRARDVARMVITGGAAGGRRAGRRRIGPVIAVVAAALVALVIMGVVLLRAGDPPTPADSPVPVVPVVPPARVDWGMDATLELTPDPGASVEVMEKRLEASIAQRAAFTDAAGVEIVARDAGAGRVRVRLPGASTRSQPVSFLGTDRRTRLYDADRDVIATASTPSELRTAAARTHRSGTPQVFYVWRGTTDASPLRATTQAQVRSFTRGVTNAEVVPAGADTEVVTAPAAGGMQIMLMRAQPRVPSRAIVDWVDPPSGEPREFVLRLDPSAVPSDVRRVIVATTSDGERELGTTFVGRADVPAERSQLPVRVEGEMSLAAIAGPSAIRHPDPAGRIRVVGTTSYGRRPLDSFGPAGSPTAGTRHRNVIEYRRADGGTVVVRIGVRDGRIVELSGGGGAITGPDVCSPGVGTPRVVRCLSAVGPVDPAAGPNPEVAMVAGRARSDVARVAVRIPGGPRADGVIQNGWFYAEVIRNNPTAGRPVLPSDATNPQVLAWDRDGRPIPVAAGG